MTFGWINGFGAAVVVLMLLPNILYAIKNKDEQNLCKSRVMNVIEQAGRYGCIVLMWLPLLIPEFGFASVAEMLLYAAGNAALLTAYWVVYAFYCKGKTTAKAIALAVIPSCIFLGSGVLLRHWLLVGFAILFAVGHIFVTVVNARAREAQKGNE